LGRSLVYGEFSSYRGRIESIRRALKSLCRRGYVEKDVYKGVIIYTAALSKDAVVNAAKQGENITQ
jgi:hypothetical protein